MGLETYETQSLYEAAYLLTRDFSLAGKRKEGNKVTILFNGKNITEEALKFYNGGKVEAKRYSDCYRSLKDYIFKR